MTRKRFGHSLSALFAASVFLCASTCLNSPCNAAQTEQAFSVITAPTQTDYTQRLGEALPLDLSLADTQGHTVKLGSFFGGPPVVLVLGYYLCDRLCGTVMQGVIESLVASHLPPQDYRIVAVSIDPTETPDIAARKQASYLGEAPTAAKPDLHLLTASAAASSTLAASVGFAYLADRTSGEGQSQQYIHPAGFVVATPDGHISRYLLGVHYEPKDLRLALVDASTNRVGSLSDRLLLLCSHYDPQTGHYTTSIMRGLRILCALIVLMLLAYIWRHRSSRKESS